MANQPDFRAVRPPLPKRARDRKRQAAIEGRPIARMVPSKDPANFDKEALARIWLCEESLTNPPCVFNGVPAMDFHHIYGRGQEFGAKHKHYELRHMFSSVFNACPISRAPHDRCPFLNHSGMREALFSHVYKVVMSAVTAGRYYLTDIDVMFLEWQQSLTLGGGRR